MIWNKAFKNGPSKICGRQPLKNLLVYGLFKQPYPFKFFKGCLPQILLGLLLNTLSYIENGSLKNLLKFKGEKTTLDYFLQ